ncbi:MAG: hypothetical protein Q9195_005752 [Heterodermia aff. obscurata]
MTSTSRKPFANFGNGSSLNNETPRPANGTAFGSGFGAGSAGWNGGIWSTAIGSGLKSGLNDSGRALGNYCRPGGFSARLADALLGELSNAAPTSNEAITGSGSLLSSSESDGFSGRHATPWKSVDDPSPGLTKVHSNHSNTSAMHRQNSSQLASQSFSDTSSTNPSYFPTPPTSMGPPNKPHQTQFLDPTQRDFVTSSVFEPMKLKSPSRHNSDEETRPTAMNLPFGGIDSGLSIQSGRQNYYPNFSGHNSSAASRSGSIPPSRHDTHQSVSRLVDEMPRQQFSQFGSAPSHRPHLSAQGSMYPSNGSSVNQKFDPQSSSADLGSIVGKFDKLSLPRGNNTMYSQHNRDPQNLHDELADEYARQPNGNNASEMWELEDAYIGNQAFSPEGLHPGSLPSHEQPYRSSSYGTSYSHSPSNSETRRMQHSPYLPSGGTPSSYQQQAPSRGSFNSGAVAPGQAALLDRKLRGLQQEQQGYHPNPLQFRPQMPQDYNYHPQHALRMNPLSAYYPMGPMPNMLNPPILRGPARDQDIGQHLRSALLEEFRSNSKTNKRYELKDIYNHIVEFSGDQHGSRFIQLKLETANSDEKDQVFREIHPNSIQLMTDVFGNYVIQKFFEHGNQSQKKILANQMRTHVLTLSLQMYGCRVALEHILTDQQAQLVKELEKDVLKCVKDQNGNHVIQKAIERVPAEHIQFIINAFTGQVQALATHSYGCRVIQRMLEHCEEPTRSAVLQELHACTTSLIVDQFGNYVTQHVIEHGRESDRAQVISLVTAQLVNFSRHKFASNVVEKSIQFGNDEQRKKIVDTITAPNEKGETAIALLIRDQYGNYVIQKLLTQLKGSEYDEFFEFIKPQLALQKRFGSGKNITAIEKVIYSSSPNGPTLHSNNSLTSSMPVPINTSAAPTPPLVLGDGSSPQSSSIPSTTASSIADVAASRKSSASNALEVLTPTST